jgi:hypothetical protein
MEVLSARATGLVSYYHLLWNDIAIGLRSRGRRRKKREKVDGAFRLFLVFVVCSVGSMSEEGGQAAAYLTPAKIICPPRPQRNVFSFLRHNKISTFVRDIHVGKRYEDLDMFTRRPHLRVEP